MLRHMQNHLHERQLPPSYFIDVGTIMEQAHFEREAEYARELYAQMRQSGSCAQRIVRIHIAFDSMLFVPYNTTMGFLASIKPLQQTEDKHRV